RDGASFAGEDRSAVGHGPGPFGVADRHRVGPAASLDDEADPVEPLVEDRRGALSLRLRFGPAGVLDRELQAFVAAGAAERFVDAAVAVEVVVADAAVEAVGAGVALESIVLGGPDYVLESAEGIVAVAFREPGHEVDDDPLPGGACVGDDVAGSF